MRMRHTIGSRECTQIEIMLVEYGVGKETVVDVWAVSMLQISKFGKPVALPDTDITTGTA